MVICSECIHRFCKRFIVNIADLDYHKVNGYILEEVICRFLFAYFISRSQLLKYELIIYSRVYPFSKVFFFHEAKGKSKKLSPFEKMVKKHGDLCINPFCLFH